MAPERPRGSLPSSVLALPSTHGAAYALFRAHVFDEPNGLAAFLKGHLWVEQALNNNLRAQLRRPEAIDIERESFARKVSLVTALGMNTYWANSIRAMNGVRNRLAHDLHRELQEEDAAAIFAPLIDGLRDDGITDVASSMETGLRENPFGSLNGWFEFAVATVHLASLVHEHRQEQASVIWGHDFLDMVIVTMNETTGMSLDAEKFRHVLPERAPEPPARDVWVNKH